MESCLRRREYKNNGCSDKCKHTYEVIRISKINQANNIKFIIISNFLPMQASFFLQLGLSRRWQHDITNNRMTTNYIADQETFFSCKHPSLFALSFLVGVWSKHLGSGYTVDAGYNSIGLGNYELLNIPRYMDFWNIPSLIK